MNAKLISDALAMADALDDKGADRFEAARLLRHLVDKLLAATTEHDDLWEPRATPSADAPRRETPDDTRSMLKRGRNEWLAEQISKARRSLSRGVKTRDVGKCEECGGSTQSGMDPFCHDCAIRTLDYASLYLQETFVPPTDRELAKLDAARRRAAASPAVPPAGAPTPPTFPDGSSTFH